MNTATDGLNHLEKPLKQTGGTLWKLLGGSAAFVLLLCGLGVGLTWQPDQSVERLTPRWAKAPSQWLDLAIPATAAAHGGLAAPATRIRVHVRDEGPRDDAEPIVLVHGTGASLHTWDGWAAQLTPTRRVVRLDLPAYGLTGPFDDHVYSMARYSAVLVALTEALKLPAAAYAGNSLGGMIAWEHALRAPAAVSRLILIDAAGYPLTLRDVPIGFRIARTPVLKQVMQYSLPRSVIEASVKNVYADPNKVRPELVDRYYDMTSRAGNRAAVAASFEQRNADAQAGLLAERVKLVKQPTFILWGAEDRLIPPEHAQIFKRDIPHAQLAVLPALGHVPMEEDPKTSLAAVRAFLASPRP